jgi:sn1-specific diacylglycerol lipase
LSGYLPSCFVKKKKGMVQTATYIRNKLEKENLLGKAFAHNPERGTPDFRLVLVGHSLGAGTAAILALLLRHEYPHVHCYAYSPPGGLLRWKLGQSL